MFCFLSVCVCAGVCVGDGDFVGDGDGDGDDDGDTDILAIKIKHNQSSDSASNDDIPTTTRLINERLLRTINSST